MSAAMRVFAFLAVCCCLSNADKAPIYGMESETRIPEDFILVKEFEEELDLHRQLAIFINDVVMTTEFRSMTKDAYLLPPFLAARMSITDEDLELILDHPLLKYVQANDKIYAQQLKDEECVIKRSGFETWAQSRVYSRDLPDYTKDHYSLLENDCEGVDVYVMDTGIDPHHALLESRVKQAYIAVKNDALQAEGPYDLNGHGTHAAGLITGKVYGICQAANLINVKVLGSNGEGTIADAIRGLQFILNDFYSKKLARGEQALGVVNVGFSTILPAPGLDEAVTMLIDGYFAKPLELSVVVPAGNYYGDASMVSPARDSQTITVGATNILDEIDHSSNAGEKVLIFAPGSHIVSAWIGEDSPVKATSGTSNAAAIVAASIAKHIGRQDEAMKSLFIRNGMKNFATLDALNLNPERTRGSINQLLPGTPNMLLYIEGCPMPWEEEEDVADGEGVVEDDFDEDGQ